MSWDQTDPKRSQRLLAFAGIDGTGLAIVVL